jgi:hypothetical protein
MADEMGWTGNITEDMIKRELENEAVNTVVTSVKPQTLHQHIATLHACPLISNHLDAMFCPIFTPLFGFGLCGASWDYLFAKKSHLNVVFVHTF